jgi:putative ABC transport system permease protein
MGRMSSDVIGPELDWRLAVAVVLLVVLGVVVARAGRLPTAAASVRAVARASVQLLLVAGVITVALERVWSSVLFAGVMLGVATATAAGRVDARRSWPWILLTLAAGVVPVLVIVFGSGAAPFEPPTIVSICGIVIGNTMTAFALSIRRAFGDVRSRFGQVEGALALGFSRQTALTMTVDPDRPEALVPGLDQTRTVGLVTLPGAFVGVLLGGGSPGDAAAAQLIVLVGLLTAQTITVVVGSALVAQGRILPTDLASRLPAA